MIELHPDLELTTTDAERILAAWLGSPVRCSQVAQLEGGLVNSVFALDFDRPPNQAVVKLHGRDGEPFAEEAHALDHLRTHTACPVPSVYLHDSSGTLVPHAFLLLEHVPGVCLDTLELEPDERAGVDAQLADILGELHGHTGARWGRLDIDEGHSTWAELVVGRLVDVRGQPTIVERLTPDVLARVDQAIALTQLFLDDPGTPTLVHGDVWDGNVMVRREDERWRVTGLLDPSLQFADVDAELAYLEVFDHSREDFFAAYTEHRSVRPGYERRRLVYWLHTALVHVALFDDEFFRGFTARTADEIVRLGRDEHARPG